MNLLNGILWAAAIAAAVIAIAQFARQSMRLRDELEELRARSRGPQEAGGRGTGVRPMFAELYEDVPVFGKVYEGKASPLDGIGVWPGVPLACAAAGLFAISIVTGHPGRVEQGPGDSTVAADMVAARQRHDSLARTVAHLRDSVEVFEKGR